MLDIVYIILHYKTIADTVTCVNSILASQEKKSRIMVIDNGSDDGSYETLLETFANSSCVRIYTTGTNLGFANGFNFGIGLLRKENRHSFIVLLNNDTVLSQPNWYAIVNQLYEQYNFAVLGPDILSPDGKEHLNPFKTYDFSPAGIKREEKYLRRLQKTWFLYQPWLLKLKQKICDGNNDEHSYETEAENVTLQGSCLILSPEYFQFYEGLFPGTFLYYEESALKYRCDLHGYKMVYTPQLQIIHMGSSATKVTAKNYCRQVKFLAEQGLKSILIIEDSILEYNRFGAGNGIDKR